MDLNPARGLLRRELILSGSREGERNTSDLDDNDPNHSDMTGHDSGSLNKESQNSGDIKAWDLANEYLFSVLRLATTTGAVRGVLLNFERKNGQPDGDRQAWLAFENNIRILLASAGEHFCGV